MTASSSSSSSSSSYLGYAYAYPHKTAYGRLDPPVALGDAWADEPKDALFLYLHVPFCEMRCGYCNLFTRARPAADEVTAYLAALARQARRTRDALGPARFARLAIGGGTPTFLGVRGLEEVLDLAAVLGAAPDAVPASVETSPGTASDDVLGMLSARGVQRISIGVESFADDELDALGRPERAARARRALDRIRRAGFPVLNVDLIYGIAGQTRATWLASLRAALAWAPEEVFIYPLYVRPLTGLGRRRERGTAPEADAARDPRRELYVAGRDFLRAAGYEQRSMRMFRRSVAGPAGDGGAGGADGPDYCCQEDGLVGLGCGARSYTRALHYASPFAVGAPAVREILADYAARPEHSFAEIDWGVRLDPDEQRRRYVIKSLLRADGLALGDYRLRFGTDARADLPQLARLEADGLVQRRGDALCPTDAGLELADTIGPWLYSARVAGRMAGSALR